MLLCLLVRQSFRLAMDSVRRHMVPHDTSECTGFRTNESWEDAERCGEEWRILLLNKLIKSHMH
jgi:hypothetical protein